jgi:hypothetical protein
MKKFTDWVYFQFTGWPRGFEFTNDQELFEKYEENPAEMQNVIEYVLEYKPVKVKGKKFSGSRKDIMIENIQTTPNRLSKIYDIARKNNHAEIVETLASMEYFDWRTPGYLTSSIPKRMTAYAKELDEINKMMKATDPMRNHYITMLKGYSELCEDLKKNTIPSPELFYLAELIGFKDQAQFEDRKLLCDQIGKRLKSFDTYKKLFGQPPVNPLNVYLGEKELEHRLKKFDNWNLIKKKLNEKDLLSTHAVKTYGYDSLEKLIGEDNAKAVWIRTSLSTDWLRANDYYKTEFFDNFNNYNIKARPSREDATVPVFLPHHRHLMLTPGKMGTPAAVMAFLAPERMLEGDFVKEIKLDRRYGEKYMQQFSLGFLAKKLAVNEKAWDLLKLFIKLQNLYPSLLMARDIEKFPIELPEKVYGKTLHEWVEDETYSGEKSEEEKESAHNLINLLEKIGWSANSFGTKEAVREYFTKEACRVRFEHQLSKLSYSSSNDHSTKLRKKRLNKLLEQCEDAKVIPDFHPMIVFTLIWVNMQIGSRKPPFPHTRVVKTRYPEFTYYGRVSPNLLNMAVSLQPSVVKFLIDNGADVNGVDDNGDTPLHIALKANRPDLVKFDLVKLLVESGADVKALDLYLALKANRPDLVKLFVESGADVNALDIEDRAKIAEMLPGVLHGPWLLLREDDAAPRPGPRAGPGRRPP